MRRQRLRRLLQGGFFLLFVLAPPLDLLRFDLEAGHAYLLGHPWTLGLEGLADGTLSATEAAGRIFWRALVPVLLVVALGVWMAWRFGRLYCGWLCPHFSVVESINELMRRARGAPSLWERKPLPPVESDGSRHPRDRRYWIAVVLVAVAMALLWAVVLLTYLLPPEQVYGNLLRGEPTRNQALFIGVATLLFTIDFLFARHLFCRFGCAVGLFQSLAWMANDRALVVDFDRHRGAACRTCTQACDNACPMRLNPRKNKRHMFTCTQCARCVDACARVQAPGESLIHWREGGRGVQSARQAPAHFDFTKPGSDARWKRP